MADNTVNITYETIFELLRLERNREEIQKLDSNFLSNLLNYLKEKKAIIDKETQSTLFGAEERESTLNQLENIKKIVKELYERREKKIINMAINKSRTKSNIINTANLLEEEKAIFESVVKVLDKFRSEILANILSFKEVNICEERTASNSQDAHLDCAKEEPATKLVRFKHAVPKFVGTNLEVYGPYEEEDMANLATEIANVLISKGRVEEVKKHSSKQ